MRARMVLQIMPMAMTLTLDDDEAHDPHRHDAQAAVSSDIIGSYESAGVKYTLYEDGSVVAESGKMRETYASLEELRTAFERGESVFSV